MKSGDLPGFGLGCAFWYFARFGFGSVFWLFDFRFVDLAFPGFVGLVIWYFGLDVVFGFGIRQNLGGFGDFGDFSCPGVGFLEFC